ncbi:MAG: reverse transcriptase family protein [Pseudomonadota bacterium]
MLTFDHDDDDIFPLCWEHSRLAALMLAQGWDRTMMTAAVQAVWDGDQRIPDLLVGHTMHAWRQPYPPDRETLAEILAKRWDGKAVEIGLVTTPPSQTPGIADVPRFDNPQDLADWLGITIGHLEWFADCHGRTVDADAPKLGHYTQTFLRKKGGGLRVVEAPRPRLKAIQRKILREVLNRVPAHPDSFGFVHGRNAQQGAARHVGEEIVISCDLADFFPSIPAARVHAIFRCLGYSHSVARLLTGLTTTRTPKDCAAALSDPEQWRQPHLPQGAPTSPALANMAARRLDIRLSGLARSLGAAYSRYADDLTFSGDRGLAFDGGAPVLELIGEIVSDCGFTLNPAKIRIMKRSARQSVTGIVVNRHLNIRRGEYDRLKGILTNCDRHGPEGQNRTGHPEFRRHLDGRITWVESVNPRRGARLREIFTRIDWT